MWSIGLIVNNVKISKQLAKKLFAAQKYEEELWYDVSDVIDDDGLLDFNSDHMEHMDFLGTHDHIVSILKKAKVKGDICFGSLEGDNAGTFWGYRFDGLGGMTTLTGKLTWAAEKPKKQKR